MILEQSAINFMDIVHLLCLFSVHCVSRRPIDHKVDIVSIYLAMIIR